MNKKIAIPIFSTKTEHHSINSAYIEYVANAGFEPIIISPFNNIEEYVKQCDGLLLPGGIDVDPIYYNEDNDASFNSNPLKDAFERELFHRFRPKKVFGICRGFQLILREFLHHNPFNKIYFTQHINDHSLAEDLKIDRSSASHHIFERKLYQQDPKPTKRFVNSMHHQAVITDSIKDILNSVDPEVLAYSLHGIEDEKKEWVIEAIDIKCWNARAVQWHPEEMKDYALIQYFFK